MPVSRRQWGAPGLLRSMLAVQCALAVMVVVGDIPTDFLRGLPGAGPDAPAIDKPVQPGDQTRRFEPDSVPWDLPAMPGLPSDPSIPSRLEFTRIDGMAGDTALLNGAIAGGDADRLAKWLKALPEPPARFELNSPGGEVSEALEIGQMIRETGIPVSVKSGAFCFSACPYVLAGGAVRTVSRGAYVGVHQHYFGENTFLPAFLLVSDIQSGQAEVMTYLGDMGIDPLLMVKALMTPPNDIYILLPEELEAFRLSTELVD